MPSKSLAWLDDELAALDTLGLRRRLRERSGPQGPLVEVAGNRVVNFGSNDYLGLACDSRLSAAVAAALPHEAWGAGASPLIFGRSNTHVMLEKKLAEFEGAEAALLFSSGYAANVGTIAALAARGDMIFSDEKNHASIIDGCRLSGARVQIYPHRNLDYLKNMLAQASQFRRRMIVTDSLFSMDGDVAPLVELAEFAEIHDAMLVVDEAHATGVFGEQGRGLCEAVGIEDRVAVRIGTLSKALGSGGGFVAGSQKLIDWLANRARSYVFSTAPPAAWCAAASAAIDVVREEPQRRQTLLARCEKFRRELQSQGWNTGDCASQIVPILLGEVELTMRMAAALFERGFLVPGIRPPSVPEGESLLRVSLSFAHTDEMLAKFLAALADLRVRRL